MHCLLRSRTFAATLLAMTVLSATASAQGNRGFSVTVPVALQGEEASTLENLWVLEVRLKPLRMIRVELPDPRTGETQEQWVWYQVYQVINRPVTRPTDPADREPQNAVDPPPGEPLFIPHLVLVTHDDGERQIVRDQVLPEAIEAIERRERMDLLSTREIIAPIPPETPYDAQPTDVLTGVATWTGLNPESDYFTVYMTGFSNGFKLGKGPDGEPLVLRRTIVHEHWRPGDRFELSEREIRERSAPRWEYLPDDIEAAVEAAPAAAESAPAEGGAADDAAAAPPAQE